MADWAYVPNYSHRLSVVPPPTLISRFEDGKELRRQKHATFLRELEEDYTFTGSERDAVQTFYEGKGLLTTFTKLGYDVFGTPSHEITVRFDGPLEFTTDGFGVYNATIRFVQVVT